ncbi:glycoside hydrolase family 25 protein [Saccharomonospora glauca]|uniref:Lysozyme n=1 Tax=Saccharomonospora glauca K62 TaxID=928724 RepID=I1D5C7_9PSEU|nr:glycoside hydrolase family 25 protein [Saccharomonospora glauca]EIF00152.1 lysozyme M1 (1,4-beta-N-acetylmuramidase) [Saccharomonospora glauca K62]
MPIFGIDISHHQGSFDVERAAREGIDFFIFKATEGSSFVDPRFAENVAKARRTGKPFAAYHYQRSGASAAAQVAHVRKVVSPTIPVIPDVEANSGSISLTRDIVARLRAAGYSVPLLYLPRWYWQQIGSPSLAGLPPLWSSRYPDNVIGDIRDEYADVPPHFWDGYGGLRVAVLQFTSSARVAGRAPIDGNAYRGTLAQLRALFRSSGAPATPQQEDTMPVKLSVGTHAQSFQIPEGAEKLAINCPHGELKVRALFFVGNRYPSGKEEDGLPKFDFRGNPVPEGGKTVHRLRPWRVDIPEGATNGALYYEYPKPDNRYEYSGSLDFVF